MAKKYNAEMTKKLAGVFKKVFSFLYVLTLVVLALSVIAAIAVLFLPKEFFTVRQFRPDGIFLDIGSHLRYSLAASNIQDTVSLRGIAAAVAGISVIYCLSFMVIFRNIRDMLSTVVASNPFDEKNSSRMVNIAAIIIGGSFLFNSVNGLFSSRVIETFGIPGISVNYSVDLYLLLTGFLILVFSGVFKYGSYLQREHDQTV